MDKIKALIVDDSVVYRSQIRAALSRVAGVEIVGAAPNGRVALDFLRAHPVDLLVLDLEMPEMDGLQTLRELNHRPALKVLVFSSLSKRGSEITLEALRLGASDFVLKPGASSESIGSSLGNDPAEKIRLLIEPKVRALFPLNSSQEASPVPSAPTSYPRVLWEVFRPQVVVIGSSTGGPTVLERLFSLLTPPLSVPIFIAQHMPPLFTATLAERLGRLHGIRVKEGADGEAVERGHVYIAPGDHHMRIVDRGMGPVIALDKGPQIHSVRPAVDPLFESAVEIYGARCLGIVLTGMGQDGCLGAQAIKARGGAVLIQDRASCVVFGMPGAVQEAQAYDRALAPDQIATLLMEKIGQYPAQRGTGTL